MTQVSVQRRAVRRAVRTHCQAVRLSEFELLGERVIDLSPRGMFIACERKVQLGEQLLVSFRAPCAERSEELWLDAEAVVARVVAGQRANDVAYGAGLLFTYFEKSARDELLTRLCGLPPPLPRRRLRTARERVESSVQVNRIVFLDGEPVFPLVRKKRAPRGVFSR